jgi:hypothetical protein
VRLCPTPDVSINMKSKHTDTHAQTRATLDWILDNKACAVESI